MCSSIVPTRVSHARDRYPLRCVTRSGLRSPYPARSSQTDTRCAASPAQGCVLHTTGEIAWVPAPVLADTSASMVVRWVGRSPTVPSGREWNGSQPGQGAAELLSPRPAIRKMQGQPRAELRPAREKNRRRRVLVVAIRRKSTSPSIPPPLRNSSSRSILSLTTAVLLSRAFFFARHPRVSPR